MKKIVEHLGNGLSRTWAMENVIFEGNTKFQEVVIGETPQGLSLFCNNERQSTEASQVIYHEGQLLPGVLATETLNRALIIGSSEGVCSQMAVACGAQEVVHVDIDLECVQLCAELLPYGYSVSDVEKALRCQGEISLVIEDGFSFVAKALAAGEQFDLIVIDLPDEDPADESAQQNRLYEVEFLTDLKNLLSPGGALIAQAGCPTYWRNDALKKSISRFQELFPSSIYFSMEEQDWAFMVGVNRAVSNPELHMQERLQGLAYKPQFVDSLSIRSAIIPPLSIRKIFLEEGAANVSAGSEISA